MRALQKECWKDGDINLGQHVLKIENLELVTMKNQDLGRPMHASGHLASEEESHMVFAGISSIGMIVPPKILRALAQNFHPPKNHSFSYFELRDLKTYDKSMLPILQRERLF